MIIRRKKRKKKESRCVESDAQKQNRYIRQTKDKIHLSFRQSPLALFDAKSREMILPFIFSTKIHYLPKSRAVAAGAVQTTAAS